MANYSNLPAPTPEGGLSRYLQEIRKFPMLEHEEEYMLGKRWVEKQDTPMQRDKQVLDTIKSNSRMIR